MYAVALQAVADRRVTRARKGQWLPDWNINGWRIDHWIRRLDDLCYIESPARGIPTIEPKGQAVLDRLRDGRDLEYRTWRP